LLSSWFSPRWADDAATTWNRNLDALRWSAAYWTALGQVLALVAGVGVRFLMQTSVEAVVTEFWAGATVTAANDADRPRRR
jgi:hypothetical protein